jgi:hypothetical protein
MRMARHRAHFKLFLRDGKGSHIRSYDLFNEYGVENCKIELIEYYKCDTLQELRKQEGLYIKNTECVNKLVAGRTKQEYQKEYNEQNKEKMIEYREIFKKSVWYYNISVRIFPTCNNYISITELRVQRQSCITGRYVQDEYDERCWIYLNETHDHIFTRNNNENRIVDGYVFNNYQRRVIERDYCPLCEMYTRSRNHEMTKKHKKNIDESVKWLKLPTEIQKTIANYL